MLKLKKVLQKNGLSQRALARHVGLSDGPIANLINHGEWPRGIGREALQPKIEDFLKTHDVLIATVFDELPHHEVETLAIAKVAPKNKALAGGHLQELSETTTDNQHTSEEEMPMLLRKHTLTPAAKQKFEIFGDPFGKVRSASEVYLTKEARYVREQMYHTAKHGGFIGVWSESGGGKTTLKKDFEERLTRERAQILVIEPYVIGAAENITKGSPMKATAIAEAAIHALNPLAKIPRGAQRIFDLLHTLLKGSAEAGWSHVLLIEEAHSLDRNVLRQFKRFIEMEDGFNSLLGVILIGQPELTLKLDERDPSVREIAQRCELIQLPPLGEHLKPYLEHRMKLAGKQLADIMDEKAVEALREKLTRPPRRAGEPPRSFVYPLVVGNVMTAAMNAAAEFGAPKITADLIREV